jgi:cytochrome c oxidase assembly protein subunit 15
MTKMSRRLHRLAMVAAIVALCVIVLGAWVRLSHAGLGCPDWPGCYGQLTWPDAHSEVTAANQAFPERPVEVHKAWKEMVHRYLAGSLVLLVLAINWLVWRGGAELNRLRAGAAILLALIVFQALLGMWTVTLKLLPVVVMGHLLGGMATMALLVWMTARSRPTPVGGQAALPASRRGMVILALAVLTVQIALGGWTSANYAALACPDLPTCGGEWWPDTDFGEGFKLWREVGVDYEGGILDQPARVAIHLGHRTGAVVTLIVLVFTALRLRGEPATRSAGLLLLTLVGMQFLLGVLNIALKLPIANAVAHNGMAAVLLAMLVWLLSSGASRSPT